MTTRWWLAPALAVALASANKMITRDNVVLIRISLG